MYHATVKPVYVLHGEDAFLRDVHRQEIIQLAIGDADTQMCLRTFDATAELADVLDELRTLPFLAPRRVVVVLDADAFVSRHRAALEDFLQSPPDTASLLLIVSSWPSTTRLYKLVGKIGEAVNCRAPHRGLGQWVNRSAQKRGKKIAHDAADLLVEWLGNDLASLDREVEKLALFAGDRHTITAEDVCSLVTSGSGTDPFALTNALVRGEAKVALKALDGMLTSRGEEFRVMGMIASHLRRVLSAQQLAAAGKDPASALNPRMPYHAKNAFLAMLQRRPLRVLEGDFRRLIRADLGLKSGLNPTATLQELIVALCN